MQGELSCFSPQQPESFQSDPQIWNSFSSNAAPAPDSLLVDLFGGSSELFNVDSVNDIIMDDNFSLFDIEGNTFMDYSATSTQEKPLVAQHTDLTVPSEPSVTSHTATSICSLPSISYPSPNPLQPVYKSVVRSSSFDHPGCPPEELLCTSDTDSGIHSPEASKSPRDDVYNWKTDLNSHGTEVFFHHPVTSQSTIDSEEMNSVGLSSGIQEPQLLNMDDHRRYNAVPLKAIFSRDNSSRDNEVRSPRAEELKLECSTNTEEWSTLLSVDKSVTSGNFQISYAPPSPTTSTATMRRSKKVSKRRLYSGKSRKSSERGKSSPHLWEFIRDILLNPKHTPSLIKWEDRETGVFRFVQSDTVAAMWGEEKNNTKMTYEKLSRAMRYYYNRGILERVDGRRLVYKFGPNAHGWKTGSKLSSKSADSGLKESTNSNTCATSVEVLKSTDISSLCFSYKTSSIDTLALHCKSSSSSLPSANVLLGRSIRLASA